MSTLPVIVKLFSTSDDIPIRSEALYILGAIESCNNCTVILTNALSFIARIVAGNNRLQRAACDADAVARLVSVLKSDALPDAVEEVSAIAVQNVLGAKLLAGLSSSYRRVMC